MAEEKESEEKVLKTVATYHLIETVGHGNFGSVYRAIDTNTRETVAVKAIPIKRMTTSRHRTALDREVRLLRSLDHENIVRFHAHLVTRNHHYLVMEYCGGGDLERELKSAPVRYGSPGLPESHLRPLMAQLGRAVHYCHSRAERVVHRDLKPANLLLAAGGRGPGAFAALHRNQADKATKTDSGDTPQKSGGGEADVPLGERLLKVADFGLARPIQEAAMAETICGSPLYMAPEVLTSAEYGTQADMWSTGALLYQLLYGQLPFPGKTQGEIVNMISKRKVRFPPEPHVSEDCRDLMLRLLDRNPTKRFTIDQYMRHPWIIAGERDIEEMEARAAELKNAAAAAATTPADASLNSSAASAYHSAIGGESHDDNGGADVNVPTPNFLGARARAESRVVTVNGQTVPGIDDSAGSESGTVPNVPPEPHEPAINPFREEPPSASEDGDDEDGEEGKGEANTAAASQQQQQQQQPSAANTAGSSKAPRSRPVTHVHQAGAPHTDTTSSTTTTSATSSPSTSHVAASDDIVSGPWRIHRDPSSETNAGTNENSDGAEFAGRALRSVAHCVDCAGAIARVCDVPQPSSQLSNGERLALLLHALGVLEAAVSDAEAAQAVGGPTETTAAALRRDAEAMFTAVLEAAEALGERAASGDAGHIAAGGAIADLIFNAAIGHAKEGALDETAGQPDAAGARYGESLLLLESLMRDAATKGRVDTAGRVKRYRDMIMERVRSLSA